MRTTFPAALCALLLFSFFACKKDPVSEPVPGQRHPARASLTRTYMVAGAVKHDTTYGPAARLHAQAQVRAGKLVLDLYSNQNALGYADGLMCSMDVSRLQPGIVSRYSLTPRTDGAYFNTVYAIRYTFPDKLSEARSAATEFGHTVRGELHITAYDPAAGFMSGTINATIEGLAHLPGWTYRELTNEPANVQLTASFDSVKLFL